MKNLSIIKILVLTAGLAGGVSASDLPDCVGDDYSTWNNCFGTYTWSNGTKYVGEWKDSKANGQGTNTTQMAASTLVSGRIIVGTDKAPPPPQVATSTLVSGRMVNRTDKAPHLRKMATSTLVSGRMVKERTRHLTPTQMATSTLVSSRMISSNGQGTYTSKDRTIREGIWEDDEFLGTVAEVERAERTRIAAEEKAERIYNACLLDKGADVDMSVSSLESALKATCRSIAEDPSFLEGLRYD